MKDIGQKTDTWTDLWDNLSPVTEIQKWDYYGLRPWILKYTPRQGKVLEAGCGLGRWVFYLSYLGLDIDGLDFSKKTIDYLNQWKSKIEYNPKFYEGDVLNLPYEDDSLKGYLSFGVVEHFLNGPNEAIKEAYRVLKPGGIAIITTPSVSWYIPIRNLKRRLKDLIKLLIGRKVVKKPFFQHEYRPKNLASFMHDEGFEVTHVSGGDVLYSFFQAGNHKGRNIKQGSFTVKIAELIEKTKLRNIGAQSITVSVKTADTMHCFVCDKLTAKMDSLAVFDVPICSSCQKEPSSKYYKKGIIVGYHYSYIIRPPIQNKTTKQCDYCGNQYQSDEIFESFGFARNVCKDCLRKHQINIELSNNYVQPIWRDRKSQI